MGFSRQEYWSGLPVPSPGESSQPRARTQVSCIVDRHFTIWATREVLNYCIIIVSFKNMPFIVCQLWLNKLFENLLGKETYTTLVNIKKKWNVTELKPKYYTNESLSMLSNVLAFGLTHEIFLNGHIRHTLRCSFWRRARQPTPVFLPGESHVQRTLAGHSPRGRRVRTQLKQLSMHSFKM